MGRTPKYYRVLCLFLFWFRGLENQSWYTKVVKVVIYQWFMRFWFGVANIAQTNKNRGCKLLKRFKLCTLVFLPYYIGV